MAIVRIRKSIKKPLTSCPKHNKKKKKNRLPPKRAFRSDPQYPRSPPPLSSSASVSRFSPPLSLWGSQHHRVFEFEMESSSSSIPYCNNAAAFKDEEDDDDDEELQSTASRPCTPTVVSTPAQSRVSPLAPPPGYPLPLYYKPPSTPPHSYDFVDDDDDDDDDIDEELKSTAVSRRPCTPPPPGFPLPIYRKPTGTSSDDVPCARPPSGFCDVPITYNLYVF